MMLICKIKSWAKTFVCHVNEPVALLFKWRDKNRHGRSTETELKAFLGIYANVLPFVFNNGR